MRFPWNRKPRVDEPTRLLESAKELEKGLDDLIEELREEAKRREDNAHPDSSD